MFNHFFSDHTLTLTPPIDSHKPSLTSWRIILTAPRWKVFWASIFLVSVPVFFQAPLVRALPELSLVLTLGWLTLAIIWLRSATTWVWGDLILGFTWTWLTGSIYWGWLRWEPLLHLPIESLGIPFAVWCLWRQKGEIGNWFYLGSLFGTTLTDGYYYIAGLIPSWRRLMNVDSTLALPIFQDALQKMNTPWGISGAILLLLILLVVGLYPLQSKQLHWWAFSGAVLSTILVDSLFLLAACAA